MMTTSLTFQHLPLLNNSVVSCALTPNNVSPWVLTFNLFVNRSIYISFHWHPMRAAVSEEHFSASDERCHCWCPLAPPALPWSIAAISNRDWVYVSFHPAESKIYGSDLLSYLMLEWARVMFARNNIKSNWVDAGSVWSGAEKEFHLSLIKITSTTLIMRATEFHKLYRKGCSSVKCFKGAHKKMQLFQDNLLLFSPLYSFSDVFFKVSNIRFKKSKSCYGIKVCISYEMCSSQAVNCFDLVWVGHLHRQARETHKPSCCIPWSDQVGSAGRLSVLTSLGVLTDSYTFPWFLFLWPTRVALFGCVIFSTGGLWRAELPWGLQDAPLAPSPAARHARSRSATTAQRQGKGVF